MDPSVAVPVRVLADLVALAGTGMYGTPMQRYSLADAIDILAGASTHPQYHSVPTYSEDQRAIEG